MLQQLKTLFKDFFHFVHEDFNPAAYGYAILVAALSIILIYCTDIGKEISSNRFPTSIAVVNNILMFVFLYFLVAIPTLAIKGKLGGVSKFAFLAKGLLFMCLIGFADAFSWDSVLDLQTLSSPERSYILKVLWRMRNLIFVLPVLVLLRIFIDRNVKGLYGLCGGNHHVKAYMYLYVVILPVLVFISFTPDFLTYYPMYKPWAFGNVFDRPVWMNTAVFETVYISDFLMVELIFRGALIIGMASILGRGAVLPMITVYVALHFGKPVMETISAFFGGYFLGALAFQTRHIWGGVIIHMGIAFIIELLRFFQHYVLHIG